MSKKILIVIVIVIAVVVIALAYSLQKPESIPTAEQPIKIGSILILTGQGASWGTASKNGIDMAIEDINAEGGINGRNIEVIHEDDQGDPKNAVSAFQKLTTADGVNMIVGTTWSHTGLPLIDLAKSQETLIISASLGLKDFNEASDFLFNTWPHDSLLSSELADYAYEKGHRNVAIIGAQEVWVKGQTNAFKQRFEELGGSIVVLLEPNPEDKNVNAEALKIKANESKIDAIISTTDGIQVGAQVAKKVRALGVTLPIYSITIDADTIAASEGSYEGMEFLTSLTPTPAFQEEYESKYGIVIDIGVASAYDAVMLLAKAMRATNSTDTTIVQEYLNKTEVYDGVSGTLVFDGKGGFTKDFLVKKVVGGVAIDY